MLPLAGLYLLAPGYWYFNIYFIPALELNKYYQFMLTAKQNNKKKKTSNKRNPIYFAFK